MSTQIQRIIHNIMFDIKSFFETSVGGSDNKTRKTKIVATIGPASESEEQLEALIKAGMNIARFNTKHNKPEWHMERIARVRQVAQKLGVTIPILLDLQGPEVRITLNHAEQLDIAKGETIILSADVQHAHPKSIFIPEEVIASLHVDDPVSFADGKCEFKVTHVKDNELEITAQDDCTVGTRKTMNTPGVVINMPSLIEADIAFLDALKEQHIEMVGLSFVRDIRDISQLREALAFRQMDSAVVAKIENSRAIENLDTLLESTDMMMVARGDLGVELPFYEVPRWQKVIIKACNEAHKPVITATQMLLSMMQSPRPTRAEVSDIANAVYDGTSAVMLSEETAMGKYAVKAVTVQHQIVSYYEHFLGEVR